MPQLRVHGYGISLDGFGAGPRQSLSDPMGAGGMALHEWILPTRTFRHMMGEAGGTTGIDDDFAARGFDGIGAWIMGRNMFGPERGPWTASAWKGWWGDNPPFHSPVFVLTHHPRESLTMAGGTTFHFVIGGIREAYDRAIDAAEGKGVRVGGGASTIRQYLTARLVDEMHLVVGRVLLGSGEPLLSGLDLPALGYEVAEYTPSPVAAHFVLRRRA